MAGVGVGGPAAGEAAADEVSVAIWSRGEGSSEVAHRPARGEDLGHVPAGPLQHELPLGQAADRVADRADVDRARRRAHALEQPGLVPFGLQPADHPGPGVGDGLVVEVDGVLGGQHHADAEGPGLLHQRHDRLLGRRVGGGRHVAGHLVHVDEGPQVGGPALLAHPRDDLGEQERGHELALVLGEVRDRHDRGAGLAVGRPQEGSDVERGALGPGRERRGRQQAVEPESEGLPVGGREEGVQVEHAELAQRRLQHLADERREVEAASLAPRRLDEVGQEDELAARPEDRRRCPPGRAGRRRSPRSRRAWSRCRPGRRVPGASRPGSPAPRPWSPGCRS